MLANDVLNCQNCGIQIVYLNSGTQYWGRWGNMEVAGLEKPGSREKVMDRRKQLVKLPCVLLFYCEETS